MDTTDDALTRYVLDNYRDLCAGPDADILLGLDLNLKALLSPNHPPSKKLTSLRTLVAKPHVQAAISAGRTASRRAVRERLLAEHRDDIVLNHCPECAALCRTPVARMCVACGHAWHNQNDD